MIPGGFNLAGLWAMDNTDTEGAGMLLECGQLLHKSSDVQYMVVACGRPSLVAVAVAVGFYKM